MTKMHHDNPAFQSDPKDQNGQQTRSSGSDRFPAAATSVPLTPVLLYSDKQAHVNNTKDVEADEYNPYDHRDVPHPISNFETLFHMMKASCGTGILAMPAAFMHAGYAVGLVGTAIIGALCTYCVHIMIQSEIELCRRRKTPSMQYHEIAREAFKDGPPLMRRVSNWAQFSVQLFLCLYQVGACSVYTVFVSASLKQVVDQYQDEADRIDIRLYMCMLLLPLILINWIRNLKYLAPCSSLAVAVTVLAFGVTLYYIFSGMPSPSIREPVGQIGNLPLFFGTVIFALEAIGVIVPLENEMKTPKKFLGYTGVLNRGMVPIIILYITLGFFGYIKYGNDVLGSITLNLPEKEGLAQAVKIMIAVAIFGTHPLQCYVVIDIVWNTYLSQKFLKHPHKLAIEMIVRTAIVLLSFAFAVAVPKLGPFISLVGALSLSVVGLLLPSLIQLNTYWYSYTGSRFAWLLTKNTGLSLFAVIGLLTGTYASIVDIINELSK